jgi:hypothetical protein
MNGLGNCQAYVEHLQWAHRHLHELVCQIEHALGHAHGGVSDGERSESLARRLRELRAELQSHFCEEEQGGCLEEAVSRCPSLNCQAEAIYAEHRILDQMLEQLLARIHDRTLAEKELQRDFQAFAAKLSAHEAAENRILQMAYGGEAADYDVEGFD